VPSGCGGVGSGSGWMVVGSFDAREQGGSIGTKVAVAVAVSSEICRGNGSGRKMAVAVVFCARVAVAGRGVAVAM
jgi:hypothetical protein